MKKILSILLFSGMLNASFAQSSYRPVNSQGDNGNYTIAKTRTDKSYDGDRRAGNEDGYNTQRNGPSVNERMYGDRNDNRNTDNKGYEQRGYGQKNDSRRNDDHRNDDRRNERVADMHHDGRNYPERQRNTKNNDLKAFGGGLILGGLLGVLIATSH